MKLRAVVTSTRRTRYRPRMVRAVLFDWRGTLVHDPPIEWWVSTALDRADGVEEICERLEHASRDPDVVDAACRCDCSAVEHRAWFALLCERAGIDRSLEEALDALDFDASSHVFYPDVAPVLAALHDADVRVAVVSDIHFDLRPEFAAAGLADFVHAFVLSYEHGVQKPDPAIFEIALRALNVDASAALMVGDRASHDGGAVKARIPTLLLPPVASADVPVGLDRVLALIDR